MVALAIWAPLHSLQAQPDVESTVRAFLQAWYVDKKPAADLKGFIAKVNGFSLQPPANKAADPLSALFAGAFLPLKAGERAVAPPKSLSDAIEFPAARTARMAPGVIVNNEFAIYPAEALPQGTYLPTRKPDSDDPVAKFLYNLTQAYRGKLDVALYTVKGAGMLKEAAVTYWTQENGAWKMAAFMGTN